MHNFKEISMNGMQPNRRSLVVYLVAMALSLSGLAGISHARTQDAAQEKEKAEEKKDEKKDEKKGLPLKSDRKISFTTDEGTWLSLDVSPDGKTIAFELLGDIYTLPIEGGKAKLIDGGMSFDSQPRFSPDGQWIAFLSDREGSENVWIMKADGTGAKQVSKDPNNEFASPSWDPSGKYIYVSKPNSVSVRGKSGCTTWTAAQASRSPNPNRLLPRLATSAPATWASWHPLTAAISTTPNANATSPTIPCFRFGRSSAKTARPATRIRSSSSPAAPCGHYCLQMENSCCMLPVTKLKLDCACEICRLVKTTGCVIR